MREYGIPSPRKGHLHDNLSVRTNQTPTNEKTSNTSVINARDTLVRKWNVDRQAVKIVFVSSKHKKSEATSSAILPTQRQPSEHEIFQKLLVEDASIPSGNDFACMRKQAGLTQAGLARLIGIDPDMISRLEQNRIKSLRGLTCDTLYQTLTTAHNTRREIARKRRVDPELVPSTSIERSLRQKLAPEKRTIKITTRMSLEQILVILRGRKDISQEVMAGLAGISKSAIDKIERGLRVPKIETLHKICDGLGIDKEDPLRKLLEQKMNKTLLARVEV